MKDQTFFQRRPEDVVPQGCQQLDFLLHDRDGNRRQGVEDGQDVGIQERPDLPARQAAASQ